MLGLARRERVLVVELARHGAGEGRVDWAEANRTYNDARGGQFFGGDFGQGFDGGLGAGLGQRCMHVLCL